MPIHRSAMTTFFAALIFTLGCSGIFQSKQAGVQLICDANDLLSTPQLANATPEEQMARLGGLVGRSLSNEEAATIFAELGKVSAKKKGDFLRAASTDVGLDSCRWADWLDERYEAQLNEELDAFCRMPEQCSQFDINTLSSLTACTEFSSFAKDIAGFNLQSAGAAARSAKAFASKHKRLDCQLVTTLQQAQ